MWNHLRDVHSVKRRRKAMKRLRWTYANIPNDNHEEGNWEEPVPYGTLTELSEDEGHLSSEDEENSSSDDDGGSSSEDEKQPPPGSKGKQSAHIHLQTFSCGLCPASFPSVELLIMHTKFAHCLTCGYCVGLPTFPSVFLWREHFATVHGVVV